MLATVVGGVALTGWFATRPITPAAIMKTTNPSRFFSDPLLVRLATAVDLGDAAAVEAAVRDGADVNARSKDGYSLLYWAMARDRVAGFEALVKHGALVTAECRDPALVADPRRNTTLIELAIRAYNPGFLRAILRQGFDPDFVLTESGQDTLLFRAVAYHSLTAIQTLLDAGATIDHRDVAGHTPIVAAQFQRDYKTVWLLLERNANLTVKDNWGNDFVWGFKEFGSRGVRPDQREYFEKVVDELVRRGLLTRQDIIEADKPKIPNPGITVIEHSPESEAGQTILRLDQTEREFYERQRREKRSE